MPTPEEPVVHTSTALAQIPASSQLQRLATGASPEFRAILDAITTAGPTIEESAALKTFYSTVDPNNRIPTILLNPASIVEEQAVIVLEGKLGLATRDGEDIRSYPPGYVIENWAKWLEGAKRNVLTCCGESVTLLLVNRDAMLAAFQGYPEANHGRLKIYNETHHIRAFSQEERRVFRRVRDNVLQNLATRQAFKLIGGRSGLLSILNPNQLTLPRSSIRIHGRGNERSARVTPIEQIYKLVYPVSLLLVSPGYRDEVLRGHAITIRHAAEKNNPDGSEEARTVHAFVQYRNFLRTERTRVADAITGYRLDELKKRHSLDWEDTKTIVTRLLQIGWLQTEVIKGQREDQLSEFRPVSVDPPLAKIFGTQFKSSDEAMETIEAALDERLEILFRQINPHALPLAGQANFFKASRSVSIAHPHVALVSRDHRIHQELTAQDEALQRGEKSVVGGRHYAIKRHVPYVLGMAARGIPIVYHNGAHEDALNWTWHKFGRIDGTGALLNYTAAPVFGEYGEFPQHLVTFENGKTVFVVSFPAGGYSRSVAHAQLARLYTNGRGERIPLENMFFIEDKVPTAERMRADIYTMLKTSEEKLAQHGGFLDVTDVNELPTIGLILQHPLGFRGLHTRACFHEVFGRSVGRLHIGYLRQANESVARVVISSVGGSGLFGDTAGIFTSVLSEHESVRNFVPHVIQFGTAGGFRGTERLKAFSQRNVRGLGDIEPGSLMMPMRSVVEDSGIGAEVLPLYTLFNTGEKTPSYVNDAMGAVPVSITDNHLSVPCPARETKQYIDAYIRNHRVASADVESGPIARSIISMRSQFPNATFTPVYYYSDDPRTGGKFDSLAFQGPPQQASDPDPRHYELVNALTSWALQRHQIFS